MSEKITVPRYCGATDKEAERTARVLMTPLPLDTPASGLPRLLRRMITFG